MTPGQLMERADQARHVLENQTYQAAWDDTRAAIIALIEKTPLADTQTAEDLRRCLKLLRDVRANLEASMNQGKLASFRLEQEKKRSENPLRNLFR